MRVIDLHCDTVMQLWYAELRKDPLPLRDTAGTGHELMLDIEKMAKEMGFSPICIWSTANKAYTMTEE